MTGLTELIAEARRRDVQDALSATFGGGAIDDFRPISGGVSGAQLLRFEAKARAYVLRVEPERVALHDRQRGFVCMAQAAAVGAAPPLHYADAGAGVAIMDFVASRPLAEHPGGSMGLVRELAGLVTQVQTATQFPIIGDYPAMIEAMLASLSGSGLFPPGALEPHAQGLARIRAVLPWDSAALVSSHNDPNPRNILFDGSRLWLIDWELAFRNDRLVDLAILTTDLAEAPGLEEALLEAALGRAPDRYLRARLAVMRLLVRLSYGCVVLEGFAGATVDPGLEAFSPADFRAAVADGRLRSGSPETAYAFGKMSLAAFIHGLAAPGFEEVLSVVRQG